MDRSREIMDLVYDALVRWGVGDSVASTLDGWIVITGILLLLVVVNIVMRWGVIRLTQWLVNWSKVTWDNILFDRNVMTALSGVVTPVVIKMLLPLAISALNIEKMWITIVLSRGVDVFIIVSILLFINALLKAMFEIIRQRPGWNGKPINGLLQTCQVLLCIIGIVLVISTIFDKSPALFLTSLGASAAVISFIFKDSLLGLIAGVQLSANNMLKVGDWIEMPSRGIDGVVIEVTLTTVKIRNWSNMVQTIPPYLLVSEPFDNWQAMRDSGGRRIKRSLNVDMTSVSFVDDAMVEALQSNPATQAMMKRIATQSLEGESLTNLDLYMRCVNSYIDSHSRVNHTMLVLVRQLQPTQWGLPIELYFFSSDVNWVPYENLQSEVMSHIIALAPIFGVRLYQAPSSLDLRN